ncbi:motility protein A [Hydrogenovibrio sp. JE_KL2]|uniref:motility protein A n=1 Tax=Hydrogenovibrio sp. JE_KL2 TaxID=2651188 RepID=UPI00128B74EA|nr:MotA/TolQ/ExbB proton channel family protein [Hydrogenovibrio sp. JE_KL2]MPQ77490.1 flagellar motor protein MotA [Hydrogenovibrio sp. JE_KL2]
MSKLASIIGLILGLVVVLFNMVDFKSGQLLSAFFNLQALLVVLGGTFAAAFINYPLNQMLCFFKGIGKVLVAEPESESKIIEQLMYLSHLAYTKGELALEKEIENQSDRFLTFALTEMMIYRDEEQLRLSLENHLNSMRMRHLNCQDVFNNMASYAPAFGMMGTVMGLIMMMTSQVGGGDTANVVGQSENMLNSLLAGMGLALVTTFYGVLFANFIFIPMAGKLKVLSDAEVVKDEIIIYGVMGLKQKLPPLMMKESLLSYVNHKTKQKLDLELH